MDKLFKLSDETAKKLKEHFASDSFQASLKSLKDVSQDTGTFKMVISTDDTDRHGEVVSQDGWQLTNYLQNPIVLWGHDSYAIPVGITDKLYIEVTNGRKALIAEGRFAAHEFAQTLRQLYDAGMLKASSVGFIPMEYEGNTITKAELLEWSFVSIPANPFALDAAKALGLDVAALMQKGFLKEMKEGETVNNEDDENADDEIVDDENEIEEEEAENAEISEDETTLSLTLLDGSKKVFKLKTAIEVKAGRVLSKSNLEKVTAAKEALEEVIKIATTTEEESSATVEAVKYDASEGEKAEVKEGEDFLKLRKGVQGIAAMMTSILEDAKVDAKKYITTR